MHTLHHVNVQEVPCWSRQVVRWIEFFAGRKYTAMRRTESLSSSLHACSCVTITSVRSTSLNQKPLCLSYSFRRIKECEVLALATLWPDCNIRERERILLFWGADTINCELLVRASRFLCFAFCVSQSITCITVAERSATTWHFSTVFHSREVLILPPKWMNVLIDDFRTILTRSEWIK